VSAIPFHNLVSGLFSLPQSPIVWHAYHDLLVAISVLESCDMQSGDIFLQHVVGLHARSLDHTLNIFLLSTGRKQVFRMIL
jgi:hypothetical protein